MQVHRVNIKAGFIALQSMRGTVVRPLAYNASSPD